MRNIRKPVLALCACILPTIIGCAFTLPTPPQKSESETTLSKAGALMVQAMKGDAEQQQLADSVAAEVVRCEGRLYRLVNKMRYERDGKAATVIIGGGISAGSGVTSAVLSGGDKDAAIATAIIAAAGGVVAIAAQLIGDPAADLQLYEGHIAHYNKARSIAEKVRFASTEDFYKEPACTAEPELTEIDARKCVFLKQRAQQKSESDYEQWLAAQSLEMISELRLCSDSKSSSAPGDVGRKEPTPSRKDAAPPASTPSPQMVIPPAVPSVVPVAPTAGSTTPSAVPSAAPTTRPR